MTQEEKNYVTCKVESEGFDYAFRHYSNYEDIKDPKFHELRKAYLKAVEDLIKYLGLEE
jgi:hypothetical protein